MTYFAEIKNGIVVRVIVATQKVIDENYKGTWIKTTKDGTLRKQYAGKGMRYDSIKDKFISKKPYPSWIIDSNDDWQPPTKRPVDGLSKWNEKTKTWDLD